ncbi:MAG: hypothetical protein P1V20_03330 [Verrucomicrobiales bacterium]|nr:hypothetical protein [Verrucomicrobiales bacterium]
MTRDTEQALLEFCARQRTQFDVAEWLKVPHPNRDEFLAAPHHNSQLHFTAGYSEDMARND